MEGVLKLLEFEQLVLFSAIILIGVLYYVTGGLKENTKEKTPKKGTWLQQL